MLSVSVGAFSSVTYPDHPAPNTLEMFEVITTLADTEKRNFAHNHDSPTSHIIFIFKILSYSHPDAHIIPTQLQLLQPKVNVVLDFSTWHYIENISHFASQTS